MTMKNPIEFLHKIQSWLACEDGQDLVEYSMIFVMIAFGTTAAMQSVASTVAIVFQNTSTEILTNI